MAKPPDYTLLAYLMDGDFRTVEIVDITLPKKGKYKNWKPQVGQPIPKALAESVSEEPFEKVLTVLRGRELNLVNALRLLPCDDCDITDAFEIILARCIMGFHGELPPRD